MRGTYLLSEKERTPTATQNYRGKGEYSPADIREGRGNSWTVQGTEDKRESGAHHKRK